MGNDSNLAMLVVRSSHFVPVGRGFIEGKDLTVLFIFSENFVICACAGRQMKLPAFRGDFINLHIVCAYLILLRDQSDAGSHDRRHRRTENQPSESRIRLLHSSMSCASVSSHSLSSVSATVQEIGVNAPWPLLEKSVRSAGYIQLKEDHLLQDTKKVPVVNLALMSLITI